MGKRVMLPELERRALDASVLRRQAEKELLYVTDPVRYAPAMRDARMDAENRFIRAKLRERRAWRALAEERE